MALRVLLADESSTIKRVMQLALQDFGVEVKSVPVGLDVLAVTKTFKPDIIFADVLLAKRSGYDVCQDLKADPETKNTPVVLMWSGFMEVDEGRIAQARPDGRLEKPFDSETLRNLVQQVVPKTQSNPVSSFLQFPKMPEFSEERQPQQSQPQQQQAPPRLQTEPSTRANPTSTPQTHTPPASHSMPRQERAPASKIPVAPPISFESLNNEAEQDDAYNFQNEPTYSGHTRSQDDLPMIDSPDMDPDSEMLVAMDEDFAAVPLQSAQTRDQHEEDGWTQQDLKKFKIQTPEPVPEDDFATRFVIPQDELASAHVEIEGEFEELHFGDDLAPAPLAKTNPGFKAPNPATAQPMMPRAQQPAAAPKVAHNLAPQAAQSPTPKAAPSPSAAPMPAQELNPRDPALIERVIREEAREVIENICWKVIPEMVERIVREEINKILRETEKSL